MSYCLRMLRAVVVVALLAQFASAQTDFAAGKLPRDRLPKTRAISYEFDQVRISSILGWLRRVGVQPPVPLSGTVSGWLWAQAPGTGWWRLGEYRVEGEVTSPLLGVDRFAIRQAHVRFGYRQNLWTIGVAEGLIESAESNGSRELGQAQISATLPTNTNSQAHADGKLVGVQVANLLETLGVHQTDLQGQSQATFRIDTTLANLSNPLTWTANGRVVASPIQFGKFKNMAVDTNWALRDETLSLIETKLTLLGPDQQTLQLSAQLKLFDHFAWQVQLPKQPLRLDAVLYSHFLPGDGQSHLPTGSMQLSALSSGTLTPWSAQYALGIGNGQLSLWHNSLSNLHAQLSLSANGLAIDALRFDAANGVLTSAARFTSQLDEPLNVTLNYQQVDLSQLRAPFELPLLAGRVTGQLQLAIDKRRMTELAGIQAKLSGSGESVRVADWGLGNIEYQIDKASGQQDVTLKLQDAGLTRRWLADATLTEQADKSWKYQVDARANALDLSVMQLIRLIGSDTQLPVPLEKLLATGNVRIHGDTLRGIDTTAFNFSNITTLERDSRVWSQGSMLGRTTRDYVELQRSQWKIAGSEMAASLKWHYLLPDERDEQLLPSEDYLKLEVAGLKLEALEAWQVVTLPRSSDGRSPLKGLLSGDVNLKRPAQAASWLTQWRGDVDVRVHELQLHDRSAGHVAVRGNLTSTELRGQLAGDLLQAPVEGDISLVLRQSPTLSVIKASGHLSWAGAQVSQLMGLWQGREQSAQWRGVSNLRTEFNWSESGAKSGQAEIEVEQLAYRQRAIVRGLRAVASLENDRLQLVRFDGGLGSGRIDLSGGFNLSTQQLDDVVVQLQRVSLDEAAQLIDPEWQQKVKGRADVRARIQIGNGLDLRGDLRLHDANWSGFPINELHTGFELTGSRDWSVVRIKSSNARGKIMGGRADVDLQARLGLPSRLGQRNSMELRLRIDRGEVDQLSAWTGTSSVVGKGKFDAAVALSSSNLRSLRDLRGAVDVSFEDTDARTLPVADQLARFVPLFGLPSTEFESGKLSATISQGDLRMRSLALWGRQLSVLGSGNVGMSSGRLDMQLVVRTGGGLSQQVAANYLSQLAATTVPPLELILQINRLVANRAIFLRIAGTASKPVIQPQAARMIEQTLLRSLLEQAVGPALTGTSVIATASNE